MAYEGRTGEMERCEEVDVWTGLSVEVGGRGVAAAYSVDGSLLGKPIDDDDDDVGACRV